MPPCPIDILLTVPMVLPDELQSIVEEDTRGVEGIAPYIAHRCIGIGKAERGVAIRQTDSIGGIERRDHPVGWPLDKERLPHDRLCRCNRAAMQPVPLE